MPQSWTIGALADCDLVADFAKVSGHHCLLTLDGGRYTLEDLGSTNGTYVNGARITKPVIVTRSDSITLGLVTPMPWPKVNAAPVSVEVRIGREDDNDFVVDRPSVSGYHARVIWEGRPGLAIIEDLGSSNGTALGSPERKIKRSELSATDTIYLGSHPIPASHILARVDPSIAPPLTFGGSESLIGRDTSCDTVIDLPMVSSRHARLARSNGRIIVEDLNSSSGTFVNGRKVEGSAVVQEGDFLSLGSHTFRLAIDAPASARATSSKSSETIPWLLPIEERPPSLAPTTQQAGASEWLVPPLISGSLLGLGPVIAILLVLYSKAFGGGTVPLLSWLGISAVCFGLLDAILGFMLGTGRIGMEPRMAARLGLLGAIAGAQCLVCWSIVASFGGLHAAGGATLLLLILAAFVGLAQGVFTFAVLPPSAPAWSVLPMAFCILWIFGGEVWPLPRMPGWTRFVVGFVPSRWAFEGLLLLESAKHPTESTELYFPIKTDRMGPTADTLALVLMLIGLSTATAIIWKPAVPPHPIR